LLIIGATIDTDPSHGRIRTKLFAHCRPRGRDLDIKKAVGGSTKISSNVIL